MAKYTYEEYINNECHPVGYNEVCESYYFAQSTVDNLLDQIRSLEEQNKVIENFKENYGYTNYDTHEMLEDLQSRAFQAEDDTSVVESLLEHFGIHDENEILGKIKSLEEQLKNAKPKFKYNQKVYASFKIPVSLGGSVMELKVKGFIPDDYDLLVILEDKNKERFELYQKSLFATREEAEKRLAELEGK